ncbi:MAG: endonuclease [Candidatus Enteromonas sp.]|nr:endonuclease [Candidatus Enteromonas sp.]
MKRIKSKLLLSLLGASLSIGIGILINSNINNDVAPTYAAVGDYSTDASTYYQDITAASGKPLAGQLHDLITSTHRTYTTYDDNGKNGYQKESDRYYENGSPVNGYIYEFYSGVKWPDGWNSNAGNTNGGYNREHVWCQSKSTGLWGTTGGGADMHHIRPSETRLNSARGNNPFGEIANRESHKTYAKFGNNATYALGGYVSGGTFEPLDNKKGDVARIVLYLYLHYNSYSVSSLFDGYASTNGNGGSSFFATTLLPLTNITANNTEEDALKMLLRWNSSDPVDDIERRRNDKVASYQGNRNPFIDNSNYANLIWGDNPIDPSSPVVNKVTINPSSLQLDLNNNKTASLEVIVDVSNGATNGVNWVSSNPNVASIDNNGLVTAKSKGSCVIKAISTFDSSKYGECNVNVIDSSSTSITANVNKTYHPGDIITKDDINVKDDLGNDITSFEFANDNYKFTYDDSIEGGDVTTKTFKNAVSYSSFVTDLVVNVSRVKYVEATSINDVMNRAWTGVTGTSYSNWTKTNSSGAKYSGSSAGSYDAIQLRSKEGSGIVTTEYNGSSYLSSVTVKWNAKTLSGRKLDIYGSNTPYTKPTNLYDSNKGTLLGSITNGTSTPLTITGKYKYIGLRSNDGAMYLDEIVVTYGSDESVLNIANYIMINDTSNQCKTKLAIAIDKLNSLSVAEKDLFNSSTNYVISTARNRLEAWARSEGKVLTYNEGVYVANVNNIDRYINNVDTNISLLIHLLVFSIGSVTLSTCLILRKKKKER